MENNILIPLRLEERKERLRQNNLRFLQQEVIDGDFIIDEFFDFKKEQVKVKRIDGYVWLRELDHFPEWMKGITINGVLNCGVKSLKTLENCPNIVNGNFFCYYHKNKFTEDEIRRMCNISGKVYM